MKKITVLTLTAGIALSSFAASSAAKSNHEDRPWSNVYRGMIFTASCHLLHKLIF
ncbi:hypothetical protein [Bacillus mycoides]|uniref:hypothetical protein n=1 Tax=Bacillus mycoides TaxID=1405 RepID=UPI00027999C7|nr:hypothetical protein [Bacillus mycoides]EJS04459.1 hypothetical protein IKO_03429 [Bacillus cereus VDM034]